MIKSENYNNKQILKKYNLSGLYSAFDSDFRGNILSIERTSFGDIITTDKHNYIHNVGKSCIAIECYEKKEHALLALIFDDHLFSVLALYEHELRSY